MQHHLTVRNQGKLGVTSQKRKPMLKRSAQRFYGETTTYGDGVRVQTKAPQFQFLPAKAFSQRRGGALGPTFHLILLAVGDEVIRLVGRLDRRGNSSLDAITRKIGIIGKYFFWGFCG
jgi:hypothetical protein